MHNYFFQPKAHGKCAFSISKAYHLVMKKDFFYLFVILYLFLASSPLFSQNWHFQSSNRFVIGHIASEQKVAAQVLGELQHLQNGISQAVNYRPSQGITVFLCPTQHEFDRLTGGIIPHWGEAAADPVNWRIFLKSPKIGLKKKLDRATLKHELVHLTIAEMAGKNRVPRWFNEGAAILIAEEMRHVDPTIISRAMTTRSLVPFDEIEELLSFSNPRASLAYSESYHAVKFLVQIFGSEAIQNFSQAIAVTDDHRQAFSNAFDMDLWNFEVAYFDHLRQNFRWYFLFDVEVLFGLAILVLIILAFVVTRIRRRRKIQEWEEDKMELPEADGDIERID